MITESVVTYRVLCDKCGRSAHPDGGSFQEEHAVKEALEIGWFVDGTRHLCLECQPGYCGVCDERHEGFRGQVADGFCGPTP